MRDFRFWDCFNKIMTYSRDYINLIEYFFYRQAVINAGNCIEDMLSTELKDRNGRMVFEKDIVEFSCPAIDPPAPLLQDEIYYDGFDMRYYIGRHSKWKINLAWSGEIEIIGNHFVNPELLERRC